MTSPLRHDGPRYGALCAAVLVASATRAALFFSVALRASTRLHDDALTRVLRAPASFFTSHPLGRVGWLAS